MYMHACSNHEIMAGTQKGTLSFLVMYFSRISAEFLQNFWDKRKSITNKNCVVRSLYFSYFCLLPTRHSTTHPRRWAHVRCLPFSIFGGCSSSEIRLRSQRHERCIHAASAALHRSGIARGKREEKSPAETATITFGGAKSDWFSSLSTNTFRGNGQRSGLALLGQQYYSSGREMCRVFFQTSAFLTIVPDIISWATGQAISNNCFISLVRPEDKSCIMRRRR